MNTNNIDNFNTTYNAFADMIFRYCVIQTRNRELALDLTQDVFLKYWEYTQSGKEVTYTKALLYRIAYNKIIDYRRKKKEESLDALHEEQNFDPSIDTRESLTDAYDGEKIRELLYELPEVHRDILTLKYVEDMSLDEIHEITGESKNTLAVRIHRAQNKLKEMYDKKYHGK